MIKTARFLASQPTTIKLADSSWLDKIVTNPATGNKVKVRNLPRDERRRYKGSAHADTKKKDSQGNTELHNEAWKGNHAILHHPEASTISNNDGDTPLHILAMKGIDITKHPDASKVKNNNGNTPLHILPHKTKNTSTLESILQHPDASKVKSNDGETPSETIKRKHPALYGDFQAEKNKQKTR